MHDGSEAVAGPFPNRPAPRMPVMATQFFLDAPHNLDDLVARVIDRHRAWWGRHVNARLSDAGELHLFGRVASYYQKQLAQEAFRHLHGIGRIQNELFVSGSLRG
jgi:hypothetical protein